VRIRTAILLVLSLPFLGFFAIGITDFGQKLLRGIFQPERITGRPTTLPWELVWRRWRMGSSRLCSLEEAG